jgi:hypothetical protein
MNNKILWVCPSKNRPKRLEETLKSWSLTTDFLSHIIVILDINDNSYDHLIQEYSTVTWIRSEPANGAFLHLVNKVALDNIDEYTYIGFLEDDIVFETKGFEVKFIDKLKELGPTGIVHAKDGMEKKGLLTIPVMNSNIIKKLGYMSPPCLKSLWADNFWFSMAQHLKTYHKFDDIMIRHNHYSRSNIGKDDVSAQVDGNYPIDKKSYLKYMDTEFLIDMKKLEC